MGMPWLHPRWLNSEVLRVVTLQHKHIRVAITAARELPVMCGVPEAEAY